jgi:hypothetical protein
MLEDERAIERRRVLLTGTLMTPEGVVQVRVRELSPAGAQIWSERPIRAGTDAVYKRGSLFAAAQVVWSDEHYAGLSFYRRIAEDELAA